jgi:hypothetical protein
MAMEVRRLLLETAERNRGPYWLCTVSLFHTQYLCENQFPPGQSALDRDEFEEELRRYQGVFCMDGMVAMDLVTIRAALGPGLQ